MSLVPRPRAPGDRPVTSFNTWPQSVWQTNAGTFAVTSPSYVDQERHQAVRRALGLVKAKRLGLAVFVLGRSVERQARSSGLGDVEVACCPCGGRCREGGGS